MNWDDYYRAHGRETEPSPFARAVEPLFARRARVIDLGCGDGRDARYFAAAGHAVVAVDSSAAAVQLIDDPRVRMACADVTELPNDPDGFDVAYLRWLLHAVSAEEQDAILNWCSRNAHALFIEARSIYGEHPTDHYRRPICGDELADDLMRHGFDVAIEEGHGFSVQGSDDPLLVRVCASLSTKNAGVLIPSDQRWRRR